MINYDGPEFVICCSHLDLDGHCAAAVVKKRYPSAKVYYNDYSQPVHPSAFYSGAKLIVTDFSLQEHEFMKAKNMGMDIIWLDHHMDRVREMEDKGFNFAGRRRDDECGAMLTWKFLFPAKEVPDAVKLVDDIDRWQFKDPRTKAFAAGMEMYNTMVSMRKCYIWDLLFSDDKAIADSTLARIISDGERIVKYREKRDRVMCRELTFRTQFQGKSILCAAVKLHNSMFFDSVPEEEKAKVDAMCLIQYNAWARGYKGTFYSPDNVRPVLELAKSMNGGGHPCAAGFRSGTFPFPVPIDLSQAPELSKVIGAYVDLHSSRRDLIIDRAASKSDKISLSGSVYNTKMLGRNIAAINHPYVTELIRAYPYFTEMRNTTTGDIVDVLASWVLTRSGLYRNGIYFLDINTSLKKEELLVELKKLDPAITEIYSEDIGRDGEVYWFYSGIPVVPTVAEQNVR